jgi:hypothetical protein
MQRLEAYVRSIRQIKLLSNHGHSVLSLLAFIRGTKLETFLFTVTTKNICVNIGP